MSPTATLPVRHSVRELQAMYEAGNVQPLEDLLRAWHGITTQLGPDDFNSFFVIGGYHGEPFEGQGATDGQYWGGYCNHGNVLFPTWHRLYVRRLELALQSIVPGVMMPYWDETSDESLEHGIPDILTRKTVELDGKVIKNPLYSYTLQKKVNDAVKGDDNRYTKDVGYETVRYPQSGLVGTEDARQKTDKHNQEYPDSTPEGHARNVSLLNANVVGWLTDASSPSSSDTLADAPITAMTAPATSTAGKFRRCLSAPTYTLFSNTTSASAHQQGAAVVPLESPHNDVHLGVGGFDVGTSEYGFVSGANGDMGENNTAGLDPIFFFHHCNVDRMFWLWQVKHGKTDGFDIDTTDPGARSNTLAAGGQGPAVGQQDDETLTMDTALQPFRRGFVESGAAFLTSRDAINIETQLGFTYSDGSLAALARGEVQALEADAGHGMRLRVHGVDRATVSGSFVVRAFATIDGQRHLVGRHSVLSRWNVAYCANCQSHLDVDLAFDLGRFTAAQIKRATFSAEIQHRDEAESSGVELHLEVLGDDSTSPPLTPDMVALLDKLRVIVANPVVEAAFNEAISNLAPVVEDGSANPWLGATVDDFVAYFESWFTWLPTPAGGLGKIMPFTYFYLNNSSAFFFLNQLKSRSGDATTHTREIFDWTVAFVHARGAFMDSEASLKHIEAWIDDPAIQIGDFIMPEGGYSSFNAFFTRELDPAKHARPIASPDDDSVIVASADSEVNFIISDLTLETELPVKTRHINVKNLLHGSRFASRFVGGTAISCVLMPNNYHRYHAPVTGRIVESVEIPGLYNGIMDGDHWFNHGDIGESTTDFSIFEDFHRSYFVIETDNHGCVAMIPVGLNTISALFASVVNEQSTMVPPGAPPVPVKKGDELGHFAYGGSLNILLFEPGVFSSVSVLMGQRLGNLSTPST